MKLLHAFLPFTNPSKFRGSFFNGSQDFLGGACCKKDVLKLVVWLNCFDKTSTYVHTLTACVYTD